MALNKNKVIASAQKFTQKGQLDRAIKEYRSIVEEDPDDVRIWLKIGDLYTKKGSISQAVATYQRVAKHYSEKGFFLKAVAVYKQILNIDPAYIEAHHNLGDLYVQLGLGPDAVSQFQIVVGSYEREGRHSDSLELLKRIVELGPDDEANRIRLAEAHARQGNVELAVEEFGLVLDQLSARNRFDDYVQVAERLLYIQPEALDTVRGLAEVHLRRGDAKRALARLQVLFRHDPTDVNTLELLATAFNEIGQRNKAVSVYRELARIHEELGEDTARVEAYRRLLAIDPNDEEGLSVTGTAGVSDNLARGPRSTGIPRAATIPPTGSAPEEESLSAEELLALYLKDTELYLKYELKDHARERLDKVFDIDPFNVPGLSLLKTLCLAGGREEEAVAALLKLAEATAPTDPQAAMGYLGELLQMRPDHLDATARMKSLSSDMAKKLESEQPAVIVPPAPDDSFGDLDLDLHGLDFDDDVVSAAPARASVEFELDLDELDEPAPDDDEFGDLLDQALPSDEGVLADEDDFGDLLEPTPAPADDIDGLLADPPADDFGDLLGSPAPTPTPAAEAEYGNYVQATGDDFGGLLVGAEEPEERVVEFELDLNAPVDDDDPFADLLAESVEALPEDAPPADDFGDLLASEPLSSPVEEAAPLPPAQVFDIDESMLDESLLDEAADKTMAANPAMIEALMAEAEDAAASQEGGALPEESFELDLDGDEVLEAVAEEVVLDLDAVDVTPVPGANIPAAVVEQTDPAIHLQDYDGGDALAAEDSFDINLDMDLDDGAVIEEIVLSSTSGAEDASQTDALPDLPEAPEDPLAGLDLDLMAEPQAVEDPLAGLDLDAAAEPVAVEDPLAGLDLDAAAEPDEVEDPLAGLDLDLAAEPDEAEDPLAGLDLDVAAEAPGRSAEEPEAEHAIHSIDFGDSTPAEGASEALADLGLGGDEPDRMEETASQDATMVATTDILDGLDIPDPGEVDLGGFEAAPISEVFDDVALPVEDDDDLELLELDDDDIIELDEDDLVLEEDDEVDGALLRAPDLTLDPNEPATMKVKLSDYEAPPIGEPLSELDFYLESGLKDDALELLNELQSQYPEHPELHERALRLHAAEDEVIPGLDHTNMEGDLGTVQGSQISELDEDDAETHFDLGVAFREMGQYRKAIDNLELAARDPSKKGEALRVIALCHMEQSAPAKAAETLTEALATAELSGPARIGVHYDLATAYEQLGDTDNAAAQLQAILNEGASDFLDVQDRLARLQA